MKPWSRRRVLVTGASGFLGSWLVDELCERGAEVTCLVRDWVPRSRLVTGDKRDRVNIVWGALEDYDVVLRALNEYEIDSVFHLGAQTIVGTASRSALSTFESNIKGTWTLLEACRAHGKMLECVVVASSDKAYGDCETLPYTEATPLQGRYPYDVSKSCADLISFSYHETYGVPVAVTRCGNLFGGGDLNFNRLVPGTIRSVILGERPIIRSDGTLVRDYFYVRDAVEAYLLLAEQLPGESAGEAYNFGNDSPMSVIDVVREILAALDRPDLDPVVLGEATHEIKDQYLDCEKARTRLGWQPKYDIKAGLSETITWYKEHLGGV